MRGWSVRLVATGAQRFGLRLVGVAWALMDGAQVVLGVRAAGGQRDDMVDLEGARPAADVTDAVVAAQNALGSALLFPAGGGALAALAAVPWFACVVRARLDVRAVGGGAGLCGASHRART